MPSHKALLLILDGWGIGKGDNTDAIAQAKTPFIDSLYKSVPNTTLKTYGTDVGLPEKQMGNSEVGHLNIGAGRIVHQMLVRINNSFETGTATNLPAFTRAFDYLKSSNARLHLLGLVSDGGVHASMDHLKGLLSLINAQGLDDRTFIHAFTDGRDTDPYSGKGYLKKVTEWKEKGKAQIASICGRYYAMDRDKRWERTGKAYHCMVNGRGRKFQNAIQAIDESYAEKVTDEFVLPVNICNKQNQPIGLIEPEDVVICFNFRTDRGRQITQALSQKDYPEQKMTALPLHYITFTAYDKTFQQVSTAFENQDIQNTLGEWLSKKGLTQIRAAETEKYPHVTFFFSGGREEEFTGEKRILIPSPKVATYDLQPEMSAPELCRAIDRELKTGETNFLCVNFANPDMVGHTGVFNAIKKACETVDTCTEKLVKTALKNEYKIIIIADHGNADLAINPDGSPNTAHTLNPVPCFVLGAEGIHLCEGTLADIAPTILDLMEVEQPKKMTGRSLIQCKSN